MKNAVKNYENFKNLLNGAGFTDEHFFFSPIGETSTYWEAWLSLMSGGVYDTETPYRPRMHGDTEGDIALMLTYVSDLIGEDIPKNEYWEVFLRWTDDPKHHGLA